MEYQSTFDRYWRKQGRKGSVPRTNAGTTVDEIQRCLGLGTVLDVGCGNGQLVQRLNSHGFDAFGADVSAVAVAAANERSPGRFRAANILHLPYDDDAFDSVISVDCLECLQEEDIPAAIAELYRVARDTVYLRITTAPDDESRRLTIKGREWWETQCFAAGFRKHPRYFLASPFGSLDSTLDECVIVLSKLPSEAAEKYSIAALQAERQLHMDMSRETGRRSDAHIVRYFEAARHIRPGDRVLDAACGLGYGSTVLTQNSRCASYVGVDNSDYAVDYARANFPSGADDIRFETGSLPEYLSEHDDASFDFIASFETLEHLRDPRPFLQECKRLLTPGGRLMISVPNDWADENGVDPNPHHFHVYDWSKVLKELRDTGFHIEQTVSETVSRRKESGKWTDHGYEWAEHDVERVRGKPGEWCIVLAMKSPFDVSDIAYANSAFSEGASNSSSNVMAFAEQYENPWLVPSLVARGLRTERSGLRSELAQQVIDRPISHSRGSDDHVPSADEAAALCVKAYTLLNAGTACREVDALLQRFEPHTRSRDWEHAKPIEVRWAVSLTYVGALLSLQCGQRDRAKQLFEQCVALPFLCYAPILATKTVSAALRRAKLALVDRDRDAARAWFTRGVEASRLAATQDWEATFGDLSRQPLPVFRELAEVVELGAQCMAGLTLLQNATPSPVYYEMLDYSKATEIESLLAFQKVQSDAIRWQQEQITYWRQTAEQRRIDALYRPGPVERLRKRLSQKLKRFQKSLFKRPQLVR